MLGLPLHRIAKALAAEGLDVAEGTLSGALKDVHALLAPLERAIADRNAAAGHVYADETGWRVFEQVEGKDGTRWWLWVFVAADTVVFTMNPTRSTAVLERHFMIGRAVGALPEAVAWSCPRTSSQAADLAATPDAGSSAGAWALVAALAWSLPPGRWRRLAVGVVLCGLTVVAVTYHRLFDLQHLISATLVVAVSAARAALTTRRPSHQSGSVGRNQARAWA